MGGNGNRVSFPGRLPPVAAFTTFVSKGSTNNHVSFGEGLRTRALSILISGTGNRVEIGQNVTLRGRIRVCGNGLTVRIGDRSVIKTGKIVAWNGSVEIGEDCLFAGKALVRTCDIHPIVDRASGRRLNPAADVRIGDRVWVALEAAILKGAVVPSDCVVGMRSLVTRRFEEESCVIAGAPARVIRRNIFWARHYDEESWTGSEAQAGLSPLPHSAREPSVNAVGHLPSVWTLGEDRAFD